MGDEISFSEENSTLGDRIAFARESTSLTQENLAKRLGIKTSTVTKWENDRSEPRSSRLYMLAGVLNCNVMWLLSSDGNPPMPEKEYSSEKIQAVKSELQELRESMNLIVSRIESIEAGL